MMTGYSTRNWNNALVCYLLEMKLLTKWLQEKFCKLGSQESVSDPLVITKFFTPGSNRTWYATEYDPSTRMFFWLVDGHEAELWYFSLDELQNYKGKFSIWIERDIHFDPIKLSALQKVLVPNYS